MAQQYSPAGLRHARLYEIASTHVFNNMNRNDVHAALNVLSDIVGRQKGFVLDFKLDIVDDLAEIRDRLQNHSVDIMLLAATDYFELESSHMLVPVLTEARSAQGNAFFSYVLLVNASSATTTIAGLRGKNILIYSRGGTNTGLAWIDVLLGREKLGRAASFFGSITIRDKPQTCILPLFFGTVEACIADETNFNLAKEMNPQLARLNVLARSRPLVGSIIASVAGPQPYQQEFFDTMLTLHQDVHGRQVLMLFKTDRLVRIQPGDLDSARELWRDYYRLPGSPARGGM